MIVLFDIPQAAAFTGYSRQLLHYYVKRGVLPATRIGKTALITAGDLKKFMIRKLGGNFRS
jgi:hypothetical protein